MSTRVTGLAVGALVCDLYRPFVQNCLLAIVISLHRLTLIRFRGQVSRLEPDVSAVGLIINSVHQGVEGPSRSTLRATPCSHFATIARLSGWAIGIFADYTRRYMSQESPKGRETTTNYKEVGLNHSLLVY
jgi:hypothetical protein